MYKWIVLLTAASVIAKAPAQQSPPAFDADLFKKDDSVFSSHIEFLYWKTLEGALQYANKTVHSIPPDSMTVYASGKMEKTSFNIDPGFRIAISYFRAPKYWEVWGQYTRMTSRGKSSSGKPEGTTMALTGTWPQMMATVQEAETTIHLNYNVADFFADRYFIPNPHLRMRVIGGITGAWMDQDWRIHYFDIDRQHADIQSSWEFGGAGLRLGTTADWYWTYDLYLTAKASIGALIGYYRNKSKETISAQFSPGQDASVMIMDNDYVDTRAATNIQFLIGPSYQRNFTNARLELFVGYELNTWNNVQEVYRSTSGTRNQDKQPIIATGTLCLQGLTTRLTVDY